MPLDVRCPGCGAAYRVLTRQAGKKVRCRACAGVIAVPALAAAAEPQPIHATRTGAGVQRLLGGPAAADPSRPLLLSLLWLGVGLDWALFAPWFGVLPGWMAGPLNALPLLVTAGLLGWGFAVAARQVAQTGQTLRALPLALTQALLFLLLFFQIACHLGAEHYDWDGEARWWDWLGFAAAHALRAGDLLDILEAYDLRLQTIQHASLLTSCCLVAYHFILDLFLISLLMDVLARAFKDVPAGPQLAGSARDLPKLFGALLLIWLPTALYFRPWRWQDILLWPVDNLLRVLDIADVLDVFQVHLHQVPMGVWEGTLTFLCRLLFGAVLLRVLTRFSQEVGIRVLGGFAMRREDLEDLQQNHPNPQVRQRAEQRLAALAAAGDPGPVALSPADWLPRLAWGAVAGCAVVALATALAAGQWGRLTPRLTRRATGADAARAERALDALRQMGPHAAAAVDPLAAALPELPPDRQAAILRTLPFLGPKANEPLGQLVRGADPDAALQTVRVLRASGPRAAPSLAQGTLSPHERVRQEALSALDDLGTAASRPLLDTLTPENVGLHLPLAVRLDFYWDRRPSPNPLALQAARAERHVRTLRDTENSQRLVDAVETLPKFGPGAVRAVPLLVRRLARPVEFTPDGMTKDFNLGLAMSQMKGVMVAMGPAAVPCLIECLADRDSRVRNVGAEALHARKLQPLPASALPLLERVLADPDRDVRQTAAKLLSLFDRSDPAVLPALARLLGSPHAEVRSGATDALGQLGRGAEPALLALLEDPDVGTRLHVLDALSRSDLPASAVPALARKLADPDPRIRTGAAHVLGKMGAGAQAALPELIRVVVDPDPPVRHRAMDALLKIAPNWPQSAAARDAVPTFCRALESGDREVNRAAIQTLGGIGPAAASAVPALRRFVRDISLGLHFEAATALDRIERRLPRR